MGCPVKKVVKKQCCSALIQHSNLAKEIIQATKEGSHLPVSVKTRIGFNEITTKSWISTLLETNLAAITIHGRTQKMMSTGKADWNEIKKAVNHRNNSGFTTRMIGNGDVIAMGQAIKNTKEFNVDGVMIGRGIFTDPWIFNPEKCYPSWLEKLYLLLKHTLKYVETWDGEKSFNILKRFFKIYCNGFTGAAILRSKLMKTKNMKEVTETIDIFLKNTNEIKVSSHELTQVHVD